MSWAVFIFGLGLLLIVAEVLIPSMGVLGTLATLCILGSIIYAFTLSTSSGLMLLFAGCVLIPVVVMAGFKLLPRSPLAKKLIASGFSFEDGRGTDSRDHGLVGITGTVEAPLRPAGTARLNGRRVDVVSRGELVEEGVEVKVIEVKGNRVVVARVESNEGKA